MAMHPDYDMLSRLPLFSGINAENVQVMLQCLGSWFQTLHKGEFPILAKDEVPYVGIILKGRIHMIHEDAWGDTAILSDLGPGHLFGETFACGAMRRSSVTFQAIRKTRILALPFHKVLHTCQNSCPFHYRLIENMLYMAADKNAQLMEKLEIVSKKTLRRKILTYLSFQAEHQDSRTFELPMSRTQLADYLCADRTAVSRELARMKQEGRIDFDKNTFTLL